MRPKVAGQLIFTWLVLASGNACFAQQVPNRVLGQGKPWETPIYVKDSGVDGPVVIVTGGVHGNEPAGSKAAAQIRHWKITAGKLIVVPRVNTLGLDEATRYIPNTPEEQRDLNRNFPSPNIADKPRGEIATALWEFVVSQDPDWLFDLHEGFAFNISHKPKEGKSKSVGSSIIYDDKQRHGPLIHRMLAAANGTVSDPDRKFVRLNRGPKKTSLASAVIHVLQKKAMILETTYRHQPLPIRVRQHRAMMSVALRHIGMISEDQADVMTPARAKRTN